MSRTVYTIAAIVDETTGEIVIVDTDVSEDRLTAASSLSSDQLFVLEEHTLH